MQQSPINIVLTVKSATTNVTGSRVELQTLRFKHRSTSEYVADRFLPLQCGRPRGWFPMSGQILHSVANSSSPFQHLHWYSCAALAL